VNKSAAQKTIIKDTKKNPLGVCAAETSLEKSLFLIFVTFVLFVVRDYFSLERHE